MNRNKSPFALIAVAALIVFGLILVAFAIDIETVKGDQVGVLETWANGVEEDVYYAKTYVLFPGWTKKMYIYDLAGQVYVMNDLDNGEEYGEGRKGDAYKVQSKDQQDMRISLRVQWSRKSDKILALHNFARDNVEERVIRPAILNVVKNQSTLRTALEAYSGEGLVQLQRDILTELKDHRELSKYIQVDDFVIEHIGLDPEYTREIVARQVAVQENLKNIEQTKAAQSAAEKAKAEAQADYEREVVAAERDKTKGILEAEKSAQQQILAAQAQAKQVELAANAEKLKRIAEADGLKQADILRSEGILAVGKAEAEATKLKLAAYNTEGADAFVKIELGRSMALAHQNVKGYLPENMNINVLSDNFSNGVSMLMNPVQTPDYTTVAKSE